MTESQILNAVADIVMQEVNGGVDLNTSQNSLSLSVKRKIGEDMVVEKINKIFDDIEGEKDKIQVQLNK